MKHTPVFALALVVGLASAPAPRAQEAQESQPLQALSDILEPEAPAAVEEPVNDPFFGGGDGDMERAELRKAAHAALSRCHILARGAMRDGVAVMLISIDGRRGTIVKEGDTLTLNMDGLGLQPPTMTSPPAAMGGGGQVNAGASRPVAPPAAVVVPLTSSGDVIDLRVIEISRQGIRFELPDGSHMTR